jgi:sporulation protein YabP
MTAIRMPGEEKKRSVSRHGVTIDRRESINVTGVTDVISFDEESVIGETEMGVIIIRGVNLHVKRINLENGELSVSGEIDGISYENPGTAGKSKSLMGRLFK